MPVSFRIASPLRSVVTRAWGTITGPELMAHATTLKADPRFEPDFRQLADFRDVREVQAAGGSIRLLPSINPFGAGARRAVVGAPDLVFRDLGSAIAWLDISEVRDVEDRLRETEVPR